MTTGQRAPPLHSCDAASFPLPLASQPPSLLRRPPPLPLPYLRPHRITPKVAANESHRAQTMSFGPQVVFKSPVFCFFFHFSAVLQLEGCHLNSPLNLGILKRQFSGPWTGLWTGKLPL